MNQLYVLTLLSVTVSTVKGQTFELAPRSVEIGSDFTMNCLVAIDNVIEFLLDGSREGSCPVPFGIPLPCDPLEIAQDMASSNTSWTLTATSNHSGVWKCRKNLPGSNEILLQPFKCPGNAIGTGITSDIVLNQTSKVDITVDLDCLFSTSSPSIKLLFQAVSDGVNVSLDMTCSTTSSACSAGLSEYQCTQEISKSLSLSTDIEYSLNIEIIPTGASCTNFALFSPHTVTISSEGPERSTEASSSTERPNIASSSIKAESSNYTTSWSGKDLTETVSKISTDNHITTKCNASVGTDQLSVMPPLVISISVVSFCLVVISAVTICVVYHKRNSNRKKKSVTYSNRSQPINERCDHQTRGISVSNRRDAKDRNSNFQPRPKHNSEISSNDYSRSIWNEQQQRGRNINNNYRVYNGADERGQVFAYYRNSDSDFSPPRQMNIPKEYKIYNGHNRRGVMNFQDPYYSYPNNSCY